MGERNLKVTAERIEDCQMVLNVEIDPTSVERSMDKAYRRIVGKANIPGFRRGKAPRSMVERFFGRQTLLEEALEELVPSAYGEAIKQENIEPIAEPKLEVTQLDPVSFKATVPLRPTVELGAYHKIRVTPEIPVVTDEEIEEVLTKLRERKASSETVERPVRLGDQVVIDLESTVEGETFTNSGMPYMVDSGNPIPVPGFAEKLVGAEPGGTLDIDLEFPADHAEERLAGKSFHYKVTIQQVKERIVPEMTDELAHSLDPEINTVAELRERVAHDMKATAEFQARSKLESEVVEAATDSARLEFPPVLVEREIDSLIDEVLQRVSGPQKISLEQYLRFTGKSEDEFRSELSEIARRRVRTDLVLSEVAKAENITASDEEIEAEVKRLLGNSEGSEATEATEATETTETTETGKASEVDVKGIAAQPQVRASIGSMLVRKKTIERLVEIATSDGKSTPGEGSAPSSQAEGEVEGHPVEAATDETIARTEPTDDTPES
ncbi:MAG: trigger factor [Chloroflexota bacterium]|nr:MAG: trigger factor [Chloroflexota bacterium]